MLVEWIFGVGAQYGVNPVIFGAIYVSAIPFFLLSCAWLYRNYRKSKKLLLPLACTIVFFISSYVYIFVEGDNIPFWGYVILSVMLLFGIFSIVKRMKSQIKEKLASRE